MYVGLKLSGWKQGIFQQSATRLHVIGEMRHWNNKKFRYSKNGDTDLNRAYLNQAVAVNAGLINQAILAAVAVNTTQLTLTVTAGAVLAANDLKGSDFIVNDGLGQGQGLPIVGNTALAVGGDSLTIGLGEGLKTALDATSEFTIQLNRWLLVAEAAAVELMPAGVPLIDVTADYYFWNQTRGCASVLGGDGSTIGQILSSEAATAGAVEVRSEGNTEPGVGINYGALVDTEYRGVYLTID